MNDAPGTSMQLCSSAVVQSCFRAPTCREQRGHSSWNGESDPGCLSEARRHEADLQEHKHADIEDARVPKNHACDIRWKLALILGSVGHVLPK